jgi:hypothetical protein
MATASLIRQKQADMGNLKAAEMRAVGHAPQYPEAIRRFR